MVIITSVQYSQRRIPTVSRKSLRKVKPKPYSIARGYMWPFLDRCPASKRIQGKGPLRGFFETEKYLDQSFENIFIDYKCFLHGFLGYFFVKYAMNSVELGFHGDPSVLRLFKKIWKNHPNILCDSPFNLPQYIKIRKYSDIRCTFLARKNFSVICCTALLNIQMYVEWTKEEN